MKLNAFYERGGRCVLLFSRRVWKKQNTAGKHHSQQHTDKTTNKVIITNRGRSTGCKKNNPGLKKKNSNDFH